MEEDLVLSKEFMIHTFLSAAFDGIREFATDANNNESLEYRKDMLKLIKDSVEQMENYLMWIEASYPTE